MDNIYIILFLVAAILTSFLMYNLGALFSLRIIHAFFIALVSYFLVQKRISVIEVLFSNEFNVFACFYLLLFFFLCLSSLEYKHNIFIIMAGVLFSISDLSIDVTNIKNLIFNLLLVLMAYLFLLLFLKKQLSVTYKRQAWMVGCLISIGVLIFRFSNLYIALLYYLFIFIPILVLMQSEHKIVFPPLVSRTSKYDEQEIVRQFAEYEKAMSARMLALTKIFDANYIWIILIALWVGFWIFIGYTMNLFPYISMASFFLIYLRFLVFGQYKLTVLDFLVFYIFLSIVILLPAYMQFYTAFRTAAGFYGLILFFIHYMQKINLLIFNKEVFSFEVQIKIVNMISILPTLYVALLSI